MTHTIGTREQWLAARLELLEREKELTRRSDELARERQTLPWVEVGKEYVFDTPDGPRTLAELFGGRSQLIVYHLMFGPEDDVACPGCTYTADSFERAVDHLPHRDVAFVAVSRGPLAKLEAYKAKLGWTFPWVSSYGTDFNPDFSSFGDLGFNFGSPGGKNVSVTESELHGLSVFARSDDDDAVYHTYSSYDRGTDGLNAVWQLLDRTPNGRFDAFPGWPRRRYEYATA